MSLYPPQLTRPSEPGAQIDSHEQHQVTADAPGLEALLQRSDLWQARRTRTLDQACQPTGHVDLDEALHGSGWPLGGLIELLLPRPGSGEIALLAPALRQLQFRTATPLQLWIDPPFDPYPPALLQGGLALPQTIVVRPETTAQWLWSAEQALRSSACSALLCWAGKHRLPYAALRKLQVAAAESHSLLCLFHHGSAGRRTATPSVLCLQLEPTRSGVRIDILKQRGAPAGQQIELTLHPISRRMSGGRIGNQVASRTLVPLHHRQLELGPLAPIRLRRSLPALLPTTVEHQ